MPKQTALALDIVASRVLRRGRPAVAAGQRLGCHQDWAEEQSLQRHPDVLAAAVVGLPHARLGNQVPFSSRVYATCLLQRIIRCR
jgi:hypothetical protein